MMDKRFSMGACLPSFGSCADRYCLSGYGGVSTVAGMLDLAEQVEGLDGLELVGNWHINDRNMKEMKSLFAAKGIKVCMVVPDLWTQAKWGRGSLASSESRVRKDAVNEVKKSMDWAEELGCPYVDVWPGQDGYDYPFQGDFSSAWKWMKDGIAECAGYNKKVKVLAEYKLKEPRTHCYLNSAAKTVLLLQGIPNTGVLLDVGHSLAAGENMAEAAAFLAGYNLLDYIHLNDNYRTWDDDMIVASVNIPEYLELAYWILKLKYKGWLTLDIFPYREEKLPAVRNCFSWIERLFDAVEKKGLKDVEKVVRKGDANESVSLVRELLTGKI